MQKQELARRNVVGGTKSAVVQTRPDVFRITPVRYAMELRRGYPTGTKTVNECVAEAKHGLRIPVKKVFKPPCQSNQWAGPQNSGGESCFRGQVRELDGVRNSFQPREGISGKSDCGRRRGTVDNVALAFAQTTDQCGSCK